MGKNIIENKTCLYLTVSGGCKNHGNAGENAATGAGVKGGALCRLAGRPEDQFRCRGFERNTTPVVNLNLLTVADEIEISRRVLGK